MIPRLTVAVSRVLAAGGLLTLVGVLPWLADRDPAYTVLRARSAEREATPEALAAVREQLGLEGGPVPALARWWGGVLRGDLGSSWMSGRAVGPAVVDALGVSVTLMGCAAAVATVVAAGAVVPALRGVVRGRPRRGPGGVGAALTAVPEVVLALVGLLVGAVWLGWFPPFGWSTPAHLVLPALALGLPAGGLLGRLLASAVADVAAEPWIATWRQAGSGPFHLGRAVLRRALPSVVGQIALVLVGLTGGAVAVEQVFAVPGLGRLLLGAASAQDLPVLQAGLVLLLAVASAVGCAAALIRRLLLGRAIGASALRDSVARFPRRRIDVLVPLVAIGVLAATVIAGLPRDPLAVSSRRLAGPSLSAPFGTDAVGRDLLARVAHGALATLGTALAVTLACVLLGLLVGCLPRASVGPIEIANAAPPIIVGLLAVAILGPSARTAAIAVAAVAWAPLAAHTAALLEEARAQPHITVLPALGVGRARAMVTHVLPAVVRPLVRHAALRLPGVALALTALGFLGLGSAPPAPEWGRVLAEGTPYLERAPWATLAPATALILLAVLAVSAASLSPRTDRDH